MEYLFEGLCYFEYLRKQCLENCVVFLAQSLKIRIQA